MKPNHSRCVHSLFDSFSLSGLLPQGLAFPFDFGFIRSTLGADGDPVDIMVLMDEPTLLDVRVIDVIEAARAAEVIQRGIKSTQKDDPSKTHTIEGWRPWVTRQTDSRLPGP